jgi:hypothetical protein
VVDLVHRGHFHHRHLVPDPGDPVDNHITISSQPIVPVIAREEVPQTPDGSPASRIDLDEAARIAGLAIPGLEVTSISLPATAYSHVMLSARAGTR